jgi:hypothetical protein
VGYEIVHESPGLELGVYVLVAPERTRSSRTKTMRSTSRRLPDGERGRIRVRGAGGEWIVNDIIDDPVLSTAFGPWRAIVDEPPRLAHERYYWARDEAKTGLGL